MPTSDASTINGTPSTPSNRNSWFSDLRAKLNQFHALDFFSNLGFTSKSNTGSEIRKSSIRGGPSGAGGMASRSVMNLTTQPNDPLASPIMTTKERLLTGNELAASSRHHSDEPRRRLFAKAPHQGEKDDPEPIWRMKQRSEPPNWGNHEDDEGPSGANPFDYDTNTVTLDSVGIDVVSACSRFGTLTGLIPTGKGDPGLGHVFEVAPYGYPTWCDKCGDFISGLYEGQAVRCRHCRFTCHVHCQPLVTLDCRSSTNSLKSDASSADRPPESETITTTTTNDCKTASGIDQESLIGTETTELTVEDTEEISEIVDEITSNDELQRDLPHGEKLNRLIEEYNKQMADGLAMSLEDDNITFRGFVQIHMNFSRPINVIAGEQPPSIYDVLVSENDPDASPTDASYLEGRKTITSFYLPRNTVKVLHITSETTTSEMIVSLLRKFKVADNPRKFALYERDLEPGKTLHARLLRIPEETCPLRLALFWGCKKKNARFVLQENETGDIMWDAFEIPELQNFLKILDLEESQYIKQMEHRYYVYRYWLEAEIRHRLATRAPHRPMVTTDLEQEEAVEV